MVACGPLIGCRVGITFNLIPYPVAVGTSLRLLRGAVGGLVLIVSLLIPLIEPLQRRAPSLPIVLRLDNASFVCVSREIRARCTARKEEWERQD